MVNIMSNGLLAYKDKMPEILPEYIRKDLNLMPIEDALLNIHFPKSKVDYVEARKRLAFEELLTLQLGLFIIKSRTKEMKTGIRFYTAKEVEDFIDKLPFGLTNAQKKSI